MEKEPTFEEGADTKKDPILEDALLVEKKMDQLHETKHADPNGALYREAFEVPDDWLHFIDQGDEVLGLTEDEKQYFFGLLEKFLRGELNNEGEEANLNELVTFRKRFDELVEQRKQAS